MSIFQTQNQSHTHLWDLSGELMGIPIRGYCGYFARRDGQTKKEWSEAKIWVDFLGERLTIQMQKDGNEPFDLSILEQEVLKEIRPFFWS